jgi:UDP-N-acetylmuramyl pentapeptide phosphotransferase/UDP-N-acetylglucosamine-1-phosphate transferase
MISFQIILITLFTFTLLNFCKKKNLFLDYKIEKHKRYASKTINYSIGGIIFFINYCYLLLVEKNIDYIFFIFLTLIFLIGVLSDVKILKSAILRIFFQFIILALFINLTDFSIPMSNIVFIDIFLSNVFFNKLFTIFCMLILINGINFIDGINTLLLGYNLIISIFLIYFFFEEIHKISLINYMIIIFILFCFNLNGKLILGDAGSYILAFFLGVFLIEFSRNNQLISPFFIISLIWYPCFELLFSIIRRLKLRKKTYLPDTQHLHQLLFQFFNKKNYSVKFSHLLVSLSINSYCLISLYMNYFFGYKNITIIFFLIFNMFVYIISYYFLKNYHKINAKF